MSFLLLSIGAGISCAEDTEPPSLPNWGTYGRYVPPAANAEAGSSPYTSSGLQTTAIYGQVDDGDGYRFNRRRGIVDWAYDVDVSQNIGLSNLDQSVANIDSMTEVDVSNQTNSVNNGVYGAAGAPGEGSNTGHGVCEPPVALRDRMRLSSRYKKIAYLAYLHKKRKEYVGRSYRLLAQIRKRTGLSRRVAAKNISQNSETAIAQAANVETETAIIAAKTTVINMGAVIYDDVEKDALELLNDRKGK